MRKVARYVGYRADVVNFLNPQAVSSAVRMALAAAR
jgi:hypothetical protein